MDAASEINFGKHGNSDAFVIDGWSGSVAHYRWMVGKKTTVKLPPLLFRADALITITMACTRSTCDFQHFSVVLNDRELGQLIIRAPYMNNYAFVAHQYALSNNGDNILTFHHPIVGSSLNDSDINEGQHGVSVARISDRTKCGGIVHSACTCRHASRTWRRHPDTGQSG